MIKLSIIICTYNREKYISESVNASLNQTVSYSDYQVVVVNNNSTDTTDAICQKLLEKKQFDYFIEKKQGLSHARNRGIEEAKGDIIAFIDDDAMMEPDYVENLLAFFRRHKEVAAVGGRIYPRYEEQKASWLSPVLMPLIAALDMGDKSRPFLMGKFPIGANMAFRKSVFEKIGLFNVNLGRNGTKLQGGEEKDLFARMRSEYLTIWYCPDIVVHHVIPSSRLEESYIKQMGIGVGESENIRTRTIGRRAYFTACLKELMKWGATFILALGYFFIAQFSKAKMLIKFRYWVSKGLFCYERENEFRNS